MINSVCGIRSTGRICTDIADILESRGHECKIAYGRERVPEKFQKYAVRIGTDFGVRLHAGLSRIFDSVGWHSKRATKKFFRWVEAYDPDVIHLHNLHGYYLHLGVLFRYLKRAQKPVVWTLHDCWAFTGHCAYFDFVGCGKWKNGCSKCSQKKRYPTSLIFDRSKRNYKKKKEVFSGLKDLTIVTPSNWLADLVKESYFGEYPIKVIPNGIDLNVFKPTESDFREKYGLTEKKIVLGVASVWDERKGLRDFIALSKLLDDTYRIVLVGLTEEQMKTLPKNILGIERTNSVQELAEIYTAADVFFNSSYEDNYPTVNLEAQACGTPVITYRTGGSVESVPSENVVEKGSVEAMLMLLQSEAYQNIEAKHCFDEEKKYLEYIKLYGEKR